MKIYLWKMKKLDSYLNQCQVIMYVKKLRFSFDLKSVWREFDVNLNVIFSTIEISSFSRFWSLLWIFEVRRSFNEKSNKKTRTKRSDWHVLSDVLSDVLFSVLSDVLFGVLSDVLFSLSIFLWFYVRKWQTVTDFHSYLNYLIFWYNLQTKLVQK